MGAESGGLRAESQREKGGRQISYTVIGGAASAQHYRQGSAVGKSSERATPFDLLPISGHRLFVPSGLTLPPNGDNFRTLFT